MVIKNRLDNTIKRILDANINRAKEGLRVCEEITRFILEDKSLTSSLKKIRHNINSLQEESSFSKNNLIEKRSALTDIGKNIYMRELKRNGIEDIFFANMQRVKESLRVLEEFSKLKNRTVALEFKDMRYQIYNIEKNIAGKINKIRI